jgi:phosphatidylglycerophosphate synthase
MSRPPQHVQFDDRVPAMNVPAPPRDDSVAARFAQARSRLGGAQKSTASVPAYLRFVNRRAGGMLAAIAFALRLTPTQVTAMSSGSSLLGIALLIARPSTGTTGVVVGLLLLFGYALDSADGQLARVRGGGSKAGEWLDHVADIAKISLLHSAVAIAILRFFDLGSMLYLAVPVAFLVANVTQFFAMMLRDQLLTSPGASRRKPAGSSSVLVSCVLLPLDHGTLCLSFLVLGAHTVFLWAYGFLALCTVVFSARSLVKAYRALLRTDDGGVSVSETAPDPTAIPQSR